MEQIALFDVLRRRALLIIALLSGGLALLPATSARADACQGRVCDVTSNDDSDAYSGVLLIPSDGYHGAEAVRHEAISCPGCSWKLIPACKQGADGADANWTTCRSNNLAERTGAVCSSLHRMPHPAAGLALPA